MNTAETQISLWLHSNQQFSNSGDIYSVLQFVFILLCSGGLSWSEILHLRRSLLSWLHWLPRLQFWMVTVHLVRVQSVSEQFCPVGFIGNFLPYMWWSSEVLFRKLLPVLGKFSLVQSLSRVWLWDPIDCSTPGLPVHHRLPEFIQTHLHWVGDAIQPSHPLLSPSPPAFNTSLHQGLFQRVSYLYQLVKVLEFWLQHRSFRSTFRTDFL